MIIFPSSRRGSLFAWYAMTCFPERIGAYEKASPEVLVGDFYHETWMDGLERNTSSRRFL
jgi:hypothetical protein